MEAAGDATKPRVKRPWWVTFCLWPPPTRAVAVTALWIFLGTGLAALLAAPATYWTIGGFAPYLCLCFTVLIPVGLWLWTAIRWVDRNDQWPAKQQDSTACPTLREPTK